MFTYGPSLHADKQLSDIQSKHRDAIRDVQRELTEKWQYNPLYLPIQKEPDHIIVANHNGITSVSRIKPAKYGNISDFMHYILRSNPEEGLNTLKPKLATYLTKRTLSKLIDSHFANPYKPLSESLERLHPLLIDTYADMEQKGNDDLKEFGVYRPAPIAVHYAIEAEGMPEYGVTPTTQGIYGKLSHSLFRNLKFNKDRKINENLLRFHYPLNLLGLEHLKKDLVRGLGNSPDYDPEYDSPNKQILHDIMHDEDYSHNPLRWLKQMAKERFSNKQLSLKRYSVSPQYLHNLPLIRKSPKEISGV